MFKTSYGIKCYECNQDEIKAIDYSNARSMASSHDAVNHSTPTAIIVHNHEYEYDYKNDNSNNSEIENSNVS